MENSRRFIIVITGTIAALVLYLIILLAAGVFFASLALSSAFSIPEWEGTPPAEDQFQQAQQIISGWIGPELVISNKTAGSLVADALSQSGAADPLGYADITSDQISAGASAAVNMKMPSFPFAPAGPDGSVTLRLPASLSITGTPQTDGLKTTIKIQKVRFGNLPLPVKPVLRWASLQLEESIRNTPVGLDPDQRLISITLAETPLVESAFRLGSVSLINEGLALEIQIEPENINRIDTSAQALLEHQTPLLDAFDAAGVGADTLERVTQTFSNLQSVASQFNSDFSAVVIRGSVLAMGRRYSRGDRLPADSQFISGDAGAELVLVSGYHVSAAPDTSAALTSDLFQLEAGSVHFKSLPDSKNLQIKAGSADFYPVGTEFLIESSERQTEILVAEGSVQVDSEENSLVNAGRKLITGRSSADSRRLSSADKRRIQDDAPFTAPASAAAAYLNADRAAYSVPVIASLLLELARLPVDQQNRIGAEIEKRVNLRQLAGELDLSALGIHLGEPVTNKDNQSE